MSEERRPRDRAPGTIKVGTLAGADVLVTSSWFLIAGLIAIAVSPRVEQVAPGLGALKYLAGLAFAVVLYGSVLLHEASHAFAARHYGYPVSSITLHFLGGATAIDGEAKKPHEELVIAVVGPITSLLVGGAALGAHVLHPHGLWLLVADGLAWANLLVGILNLVPGLPLDGGRVLKALVWSVSKSANQGTLIAGWVGRAAAVGALFWPSLEAWYSGTKPQYVDYAMGIFIAIFLWSGATAAIQSAKIRQTLPQLVARPLARRVVAVPEDLPLAQAVRRAQEAQAGGIVTVSAEGRALGIVNEAAVLATPDERRPWLPVSAVARPIADGLRLPADIAGEDLIKAMTAMPATEYLLLEPDHTVYGLLATSDVDAAFRSASR